MASVNKAILIGNLGRDPELRYTPSGAAVCTFSIATSEKWRDKQTNEMKESTNWHNIVFWGKQAELAKQYGEKPEIAFGSQIRSYVLHPYKLVKDHRTGFEMGNAEGVLEGKLEPFIEAYLRWKRKGSPKLSAGESLPE